MLSKAGDLKLINAPPLRQLQDHLNIPIAKEITKYTKCMSVMLSLVGI